MNVGLTQLTSVRIGREAATEFDLTVTNEMLGVPAFAEAEIYELAQHERYEVVARDRR